MADENARGEVSNHTPLPPKRSESFLDWANNKKSLKVFKELYPGSYSFNIANSPTSKKRYGGYKIARIGVIENGRVWGDHGTVITPENTLLWDVSVEWCEPEQHSIFTQSSLPPVTKTSDSIGVIAHVGGVGFYHWMFTVLPRLHLIQKAGISVDKFLVNPITSPYQRETLQMLGIPEHKILEATPSLHLQSNRLVVPTLPGNVTNWSCKFLKNSFVPKEKSSNNKLTKLYISRSKAAWRKVVNENELVEKLKKLGFHYVELETLTVKEQIQLFSNAKLIVSPHGAGLSNLAFCRPGVKVIELFAPRYVVPTYTLVSHHNRLDYHYLICAHSLPNDKLVNKKWSGADNIRVDIPVLIKLIKKLTT